MKLGYLFSLYEVWSSTCRPSGNCWKRSVQRKRRKCPLCTFQDKQPIDCLTKYFLLRSFYRKATSFYNEINVKIKIITWKLYSRMFREGTFFIGGWGPRLRREGSLVNFLQIGEGQTCFILNRGRVTVFLARTKLLHVACILYIQAKLPVKINLSKLITGVEKFIYKKNIFSQLT